jgi:ATP-dependent 26S proteasome regulatory subunit
MIYDQIKMGYPALWIKTTEHSRVMDYLLKFDFRSYLTINEEKGFCQYLDGQWKTILVRKENEDHSVEFGKVFDFSLAKHHIDINHLDYSNATFLIPILGKPDMTIMTFINTVYTSVEQYRSSFWSDSYFDKPQYIFISSCDVPEEYPGLFRSTEFGVPTEEDLYHIVDHITQSSEGRFVDSKSIKEIVRSGLGLMENDFIDQCLSSIIRFGKVDSKYIYDNKMASVKQKGILEIIKPKISFDNIGGLDNIKNIIKRTSYLRANKEKAQSYGVVPIRRILMVGVPGTGKSAICQATAHELGLDLARTGISQVMNSFVGQSESNMRSVFQQIKAMTPLCVWIDEFGRDLSGGASSSHVDAGTTDRVHGEFLTGLQELPEDTFLMCAANQLDNLRPEMLRADRFDKIVFVGLPSYSERIDILKIYLSDIDTDHTYDYEALAAATEFFTGAEISSLIKEVKFFVVSDDFRPIATKDILLYAPKVKNTIWNKNRDMVRSMYQYALEQWDWASSEQMNEASFVINGRSSVQPQVAFKI